MILTNIKLVDNYIFQGCVRVKDGTYKSVTINMVLMWSVSLKSAPLLQLLPTFDKLDFKIEKVLSRNSDCGILVSNLVARFKSDLFEFNMSGNCEIDIRGLEDSAILMSEGDIPEEAYRLVDKEKLNAIFNSRRLGINSEYALYGFLVELIENEETVVYLGLSTTYPGFYESGSLECFEFRRWDEIWEEYCWLNGGES